MRVSSALGLPSAALVGSLFVLRAGSGTPFLLFYPAVAIAAWYGGFGAGVAASALSVLLADYFLIPPLHALTLPTGSDALVAAIFLASAVVISRLSGEHRHMQTQAERLAGQLTARAAELEAELHAGQNLTAELEATNQELEAANEELQAVNEELQAANEHEAQRGHLFTLAANLARASTPEDVAAIVFRDGLAAVSADAGSVGLVSDEIGGARLVTMLHSTGYGAEATSEFRQFPLVPGRPLSDAVLTAKPVLVGSFTEWEARYPATFPTIRSLGYEGFAALPVSIAQRVVAGISFSFRRPRRFTASDVSFLEALANLSGQALERARAFEAEKRAHERAAVIVESVTDGFVALDSEWRYTYVNQQAADLWQRSPSSLVGLTPFQAFPDTGALERASSIEIFRRVMSRRAPETSEVFAPTLRRWIELRAYPTGEGGIVAFFQDITSRRRAQDASAFLADASALLAASTNYAQTLTNLARAAVPRLGDWCAVDVLRDPSSGQWPPPFERLAVVHQDPGKIALAAQLTDEYPTDWSQGTGLPAVLRTGTPMYIPVVTDEMLASGARDPRHLELLRALRFRSVMIVPLVSRGVILGAMTLCMTESERTYDEADLALAQDLARRAGNVVDAVRLFRNAELANTAKTEFLRTISHELRQPINATLAFLQLWELGLRGPLTDSQKDDLARVQRNQHHLLTLIEDILTFTRLDAGKLEVARELVAVGEILAALDAIERVQMEAAGIAFTILPCSSDLRVLGDKNRIVQIGVNLLTNAIRATPRGGSVQVECRIEGNETLFTVSDTGGGIPPDRLEHIFSPFTQLDRALNAPKEGAGLGLAISRGLAAAMGGSLAATSIVGKGSTFVLRLPRF